MIKAPKKLIQVKVRLYGIDAPEADQPFGDKATEFVRELIFAA
ncbi:thermonuclease family protein [Desulfonatronovibrio magnus]|nr:thermonuclease family protein [Desulfonatronovibrio magnus]